MGGALLFLSLDCTDFCPSIHRPHSDEGDWLALCWKKYRSLRAHLCSILFEAHDTKEDKPY